MKQSRCNDCGVQERRGRRGQCPVKWDVAKKEGKKTGEEGWIGRDD